MKSKFAALLLTALAPVSAFAHTGHSHESHSFMSGLSHPVTGFDHLIMLVAFGMLLGAIPFSKAKKGATIAVALVSLLSGLLIGQALGFATLVEPLIIASLFVVSLALWQVYSPTTQRINVAVSSSIALLFFHGYAHGVEAAANLTQFGLGMMLSATGLIVFGALVSRAFYSKWFSVAVASLSTLFLLTN
ncbi:HupE/UreJ family protein [Vibrio sp. M260118]|uniref:HupE/UreJ family protein n=1 Tax=Vibrio sp. M260118 TaxID=3020896 RepID=UPI002F41F685